MQQGSEPGNSAKNIISSCAPSYGQRIQAPTAAPLHYRIRPRSAPSLRSLAPSLLPRSPSLLPLYSLSTPFSPFILPLKWPCSLSCPGMENPNPKFGVYMEIRSWGCLYHIQPELRILEIAIFD